MLRPGPGAGRPAHRRCYAVPRRHDRLHGGCASFRVVTPGCTVCVDATIAYGTNDAAAANPGRAGETCGPGLLVVKVGSVRHIVAITYYLT